MSIAVYTRTALRTTGDAIFEALEVDPELAPNRYGRWEPYKAGGQEARKLWQQEAVRSVGSLGGERKRPFGVVFGVDFGPNALHQLHRISWMADPVILRHDGAKRIEALFRRLVTITDPYWASAEHSADFERQNVYLNYRTDRGTINPYFVVGVRHPEEVIPGLYWLNYFGPQLTALMPKTLSAPAHHVERFGPGVLMKLADDPEAMVTPENIARAEQCKKELGELLFFDRNRPAPDRVM